MNGDGYSDLIVGAPMADNGQVDEGLVTVYYGATTGLTTADATTLEVNRPRRPPRAECCRR